MKYKIIIPCGKVYKFINLVSPEKVPKGEAFELND